MENAKEILRNIILDISSILTKTFDLETVKRIIKNNGCMCIATNGLPFNGNTYKIFRRFEFDGRILEELIGHFKYVYKIYGNKVYFMIYDNTCVGGSELNNSESSKYIYSKNFIN